MKTGKTVKHTVDTITAGFWDHLREDWIDRDSDYESGTPADPALNISEEVENAVHAAVRQYLYLHVPMKATIGESDYSELPKEFSARVIYDYNTHSIVLYPAGRD